MIVFHDKLEIQLHLFELTLQKRLSESLRVTADIACVLRTAHAQLGLHNTSIIFQSLLAVCFLTLESCPELSWLWDHHSDLFWLFTDVRAHSVGVPASPSRSSHFI